MKALLIALIPGIFASELHTRSQQLTAGITMEQHKKELMEQRDKLIEDKLREVQKFQWLQQVDREIINYEFQFEYDFCKTFFYHC